jgi:predicted AlkP superfamily phosphohydrolase/phosphomutase
MKKALMIGLDGATFSLLKPFMEDGTMPFLRTLVDEGVHADLMSTRNPLTPPAWISMVTGRSPHVHGVYDFLRPSYLDDGSVFLTINDSRNINCETIWSMVNRHGQRATSLNFYGMCPAFEIDGYLASGFVPWKHLRRGMYPPSFYQMVRSMEEFDYRSLGMDITEEKKCVQGLFEEEQEDWIRLQKKRDTAWTDLCCHLMQTDRTELTAVVLDGPDKLQHLFWRYVDADYLPENPDDRFIHIRDMCLDFYAQLDRNIRSMVETAGEDTNVILTSDHGFGATTEVVYINEWLARRGLLTWADDARDGGTGKLTANKMKDHLSMIDWKSTVAFCPTPSSNAIYVKKGNATGNGVKDGEYLNFCLDLKRELLDYRDPATGEQVFMGVDLNKLEGTPYVEPSPDLSLKLRDGGFVSILKSDEIVVQRKNAEGTHRPNGIFIAHGPDVKSGIQVESLNLLDITPLLLHLLGLPLPENLEGRVPSEILQSEATRAPRVEESKVTELPVRPRRKRESASPEEKEALISMLKVLKYID